MKREDVKDGTAGGVEIRTTTREWAMLSLGRRQLPAWKGPKE